jgi:hypothetical protein
MQPMENQSQKFLPLLLANKALNKGGIITIDAANRKTSSII